MSETGRSDDNKQQITRDAQDAANLLNHPKIRGFLDNERDKAWQTFKALPLEADKDKFQGIHAYMAALDRFENELKQYVQHYQDMMAREHREQETGGRDPFDG